MTPMKLDEYCKNVVSDYRNMLRQLMTLIGVTDKQLATKIGYSDVLTSRQLSGVEQMRLLDAAAFAYGLGYNLKLKLQPLPPDPPNDVVSRGLQNLYTLSREVCTTRRAMLYVHSFFDDAVQSERVEDCDDLLRHADTSRLGEEVLVSLLSASKLLRDSLPSYPLFRERALGRLVALVDCDEYEELAKQL